jgi:hypothetical protein
VTLRERLTSPGPKRILALDGGGIRGAISLGFLTRIESLLRERHDNPNLQLRDYFDLIGGTSTGSVIASALATGMDASELLSIYQSLGPRVFGKTRRGWKRMEARFDTNALRTELQNTFGEMTLGSDEINTGLCIVTKRADTRSTWPLINHPDGVFYSSNSRLLLRNAVRASTAAPTFFQPEAIEIGDGEVGAFVDGGVSMANNPALLLFFIATLQGFPFRWPTGADNLLLVSVGTGTWSDRTTPDKVLKNKAWNWAVQIPGLLMEDASAQAQMILQYLGRTPTPWMIDSEVGNLAHDQLGPDPHLTYLRYDAELDGPGLNALGLSELRPELASLRQMAEGQNVDKLADIGNRASAAVEADHLPTAFDLPR